MLLARILQAALSATGSWALYASDVGKVDWHTPHIGVPRHGSTTFDASKGLVIAATDRNVLAALHSSDGSLAWRYVHDSTDDIVWTGALPHSSTILSLSGPSASTLRSFSPTTGALIAELRLHDPRTIKLHEPAGFGVDVASLLMKEDSVHGEGKGEEEAFVLSGGGVVQRVNVIGGLVRWKWESEDQTSSVMYTHIHAAPHGIYIIGLTNSFASYTLHITQLSPQDGSILSSQSIPSNLAPPTADTFPYVLTPRGVAWVEEGKEIRTVEFAPELRLGRVEGSWVDVRDVGVRGEGWFVGEKEDGAISVLEFSARGLKEVHEFSTTPGSVSYASAVDVDGKPHIAHISHSGPSTDTSKSSTLSITLVTQGESDEVTQTEMDGVIIDTEVDGEIVGTTLGFTQDNKPQLLVTTSTGTIHLFALTPHSTQESFADASEYAYTPSPTKPLWTLDEGLSSLTTASIFPLPESRAVESLKREEHEGVGERWARHVSDAQNLPAFVIGFVKRFMTGSYETPSSVLEEGAVERDAFGFRKLIVGASEYGKVYALDSSTGSVIWSRRLSASGGDGKIVVRDIFDVSEDGAEGVKVALVAVRTSADGAKDTLLYTFNALSPPSSLSSTKLFTGHPLAAHTFPLSPSKEESAKAVLLVDEERGVHVYPDTKAVQDALERVKTSLVVPLRFGGSVSGHVLVRNAQQVDGKSKWDLVSTWTHTPPQAWPAGELITGLIPRPVTPVASLGKVLGNRTTLYKLLNPHTFALTTSAPDACGVRVLDGVKGTLLYHARLPKPTHGECDVQVSFVENWLVYVYWDPEYAWVGQSKGRRVVSVELYEGAPDEKTRSAELSSFDPDAARVAAYEQAYIFPHGVKAVTTSQTKFGVTSRDLIVATDKNSIQTFPRILLNPRRPKLSPNTKPTTEMQEEMLIPYDANMPDDPRRVVSHVYDVAGVQNILSSPSLLESTTVLFAYGLDLFGSRVAPSRTFDVLSPNFNKAQLVLTLAALSAGIVFVKPMVRRKKLRERWYVRG